jgi:hypothetical protein
MPSADGDASRSVEDFVSDIDNERLTIERERLPEKRRHILTSPVYGLKTASCGYRPEAQAQLLRFSWELRQEVTS